MTNPTSNFNWQMPTASDLVTDLPADFETFGQAVDTSLADLKGGTTGQVLSKASNTDMDFNWVAADDTNAIQNTIVDAKGDLISATGSDVPARLAVGANGETLVADSSTSTGLRYQVSSQPNYLINSNFDFWQRGTSFASTSGYMADRWSNIASFNAVTASQQTSGAPNGSRYYMRFTSTGAASYMNLAQMMETSTSAELWGKTVTVSVLLRRNATLNASVYFGLEKSATVDAGAGASWTAITSTNVPLASIPTGTTSADWFRATITATVPNDGTANSLRVQCYYNGGVPSGSVLEFAQVMLEQGSVATNFKIAGGTIQGELAACQRYYWRQTGESNYSVYAMGANMSTTSCNFFVQFPQIMRISPTAVEFTTLCLQESNFGAVTALTGLTVDGGTQSTKAICLNATVASGLTQHRTSRLEANNSTSAYIGFSAEL
jgi:hypothetical protein